MVIYDLKCRLGHRFEGWFPSIESFEEQLKGGLVECSVCGIDQVERIPSGGHIIAAQTSTRKPIRNKKPALQLKGDVAANVDPVILMKAVQQYVQKNYKDVGDKFTDRAQKIHKGEASPEAIYGTANEKQQETLEDEGVPFTRIPKLSDEFEN